MDPEIAQGTCFPIFAYEVAQAIDLDEAERRLFAGTERQTIKQKRRAPASFEYRPAPLRVTRGGEPQPVDGYRTAPAVEIVLYDFGAVSVSYTIPLAGALSSLPALAEALWGNERLLKDSRQHVEALLVALGDAAARPHVAEFVEDYSIFHIEAFTQPCDAAMLWTTQAQTVAQVLRGAPHPLSQQEIADATAFRLSFGPNDATIIDTDAAILFEQVTNALKLVGDQFLARVYSLASRRFHLPEWDTSITRKLQTIDGLYEKMTDRATSRRTEMLEWIIIILIVVEIGLSLVTLLP